MMAKRNNITTGERACSECGGRGWDVFGSDAHGLEVQRCDSCSALPGDDAAVLAALRWWLAEGRDLSDGDLSALGHPDRDTLMDALLASSAGLAIAALEPVVDHG